MHDQFELFLDTTGPGLHKRGYRAVGNDAPLRETLAAGMVQLTRYRGRDFSGIPSVALVPSPLRRPLLPKNRAPGLTRAFAAEHFAWVDNTLFPRLRQEAPDREYQGITAFSALTTTQSASASPWQTPERLGLGG